MFRLITAYLFCAWLVWQPMANVLKAHAAQTPPICPGFEPNDTGDTAIELVAPATWLDSLRFKSPEQDFVDVWKLPSSSTVTQTLSLISQGPDSDPLYLLVWFDAEDIRHTFMVVDDLDKARCAAGEFWMCTARASFVWERAEQLYAEVYMFGSLTPEPTCRYYRLDYTDAPRPVTPTPTPTSTPSPTPTATATPHKTYLPLVVR